MSSPPFFADISHFEKVSDYLPIVVGCLNADLMILFLLTHKFFQSEALDGWYRKFNLNAILADVFILMIGVTITRFAYYYIFTEYNLFLFMFLAVCIQITHDFLFYWLFKSTPDGYSRILDHFKLYANSLGGYAVFGNSCAIVMSCLFAAHFATYSLNALIIILITTIYFVPYLVEM